MKKTLIIGSAHANVISRVKTLPRGNENFEPISSEQSIGGSGYEMALFYQKMGYEADLLAPVGSGVYGEFVEEQLLKDHISFRKHEEMNGCKYRMIAEDGQESYFMLPGEEYEIHSEDFEDVYPDEYDCVIVFDDMLLGEDTDDLLMALEDLDLPIYVSFSSRAAEISEEVLDALFALNPVVYISDTDAYELNHLESKELQDAAEMIHKRTNAPVLITQKEMGTYYYDQEDVYVAPEEKQMNPVVHISAYILALNSGLDRQNALMYANHFSTLNHAKMPLDFDYAEQKIRLADLITHR